MSKQFYEVVFIEFVCSRCQKNRYATYITDSKDQFIYYCPCGCSYRDIEEIPTDNILKEARFTPSEIIKYFGLEEPNKADKEEKGPQLNLEIGNLEIHGNGPLRSDNYSIKIDDEEVGDWMDTINVELTVNDLPRITIAGPAVDTSFTGE